MGVVTAVRQLAAALLARCTMVMVMVVEVEGVEETMAMAASSKEVGMAAAMPMVRVVAVQAAA